MIKTLNKLGIEEHVQHNKPTANKPTANIILDDKD